MENIPRDKNGVPILNSFQIEEKAESFLASFDKESLYKPKAIPIFNIMKLLQADGSVTFVLDQNLGSTATGKKYLGRFHIPSRTIYIDKTLVSTDPRLKFTIAHELAHYVLHTDIRPGAIKHGSEENEVDIQDTTDHIVYNRVMSGDTTSWGPRSWIEWQANRFAASLLMPQVPIRMAVVEKQGQFNIYQNLGKIDESQIIGGELQAIVDHIQYVFEVSKESILVRLIQLDVLEEIMEIDRPRQKLTTMTEHKRDCVHISVAIRELIENMKKNME